MGADDVAPGLHSPTSGTTPFFELTNNTDKLLDLNGGVANDFVLCATRQPQRATSPVEFP